MYGIKFIINFKTSCSKLFIIKATSIIWGKTNIGEINNEILSVNNIVDLFNIFFIAFADFIEIAMIAKYKHNIKNAIIDIPKYTNGILHSDIE